MNFKLSILILLISFSGFAQDKWQTYEMDNFSIGYPSDWTMSDQKPEPTIQFMLMANEESAKKDQFRENINLNTEALTQDGIAIENYLNTTIEQITVTVKNAKILENESVKVQDLEAKTIVWSGDFGGGVTLKFRQLIFIKDKTAYVLTFTSTETDYDNYAVVGDKIMTSFKFNN